MGRTPEERPEPHRFCPGLRWYAVHTRSRHERKVDRELCRRGLSSWLAEYQTWSTRKDRRRRIEKPLFPGYLFVQLEMSAESRLLILQCPSVVRIVGIKQRPLPVDEREMDSLQRLLAAAPEVEPHPAMRRGQLVQVMQGPLSGVVGRVADEARGKRIVVTVDLLGRAVSARLTTDDLVPYLD